MKEVMKLTCVLIAIGFTVVSEAKTVRATEMTPALWSQMKVGGAEATIVEFRQGDQLPVSFSSQGDLFETSQVGVSTVLVKKNFWLMMQDQSVQMSFDGTSFKPISELISGSFSATSDSAPSAGPTVTGVNMVLSAYLK